MASDSYPIYIRGISPSNKSRFRFESRHRVTVFPTLTLKKLKLKVLREFEAPKKYTAQLTHTSSDRGPLDEEDSLVRDLISSGDTLNVSFVEKNNTIEALFGEGNWIEARKRMKRITNPTRVGELLYSAIRERGTPLDIIEELFSKLPEGKDKYYNSDFESNLWHVVCNFRPKTSLSFDDICRTGSLALLRLLLKKYTECLQRCSSKRSIRSAVCHLWNDHLFSNRTYYGRQNDGTDVSSAKEEELSRVFNMMDVKNNEMLSILWEKTELLVRSTEPRGLEGEDDISLVHAMIKVQVPKIVVFIAMRLYPSQLSTRDRQGNIPLHYAAILNNEEDNLNISFNGDLSQVNGRIVKIVLASFPEGAKYLDSKGRLPLALLLDLEHLKWTQDCSMSLMKAAPQALITRDIKHHTFPFMTAARIDKKSLPETIINSRDECAWRERTCIWRVEEAACTSKAELTFLLLRENPAAVTIGLTETHFEKHLKKKLKDAEQRNIALSAKQDEMEQELATLRERIAKMGLESGQKRSSSEASMDSKKSRLC